MDPAGNPKASYFTGPLDKQECADAWLERAEKHTGSWWELWADWVVARSGDEQPASAELGSERHPVRSDAPRMCVRQKA